MMDKNKIGLAFGCFIALMHLVWSIFVAITPQGLQSFLNWIFALHAIQPYIIVTSFNFMNAVLLIIVTFIVGYIFGYVFSWLHNLVHKKK